MRFRANPPPEPSLDLTPLIDVVFLLLIFFMVSTHFKRESEVKITLPEASMDQAAENIKIIEVGVDQQGNYIVDNQLLTHGKTQDLMQSLRVIYSKQSSQALVIRADGRAPYQAVITLMDVAQKLGFVNIRFVTQPVAQ